MLTLNDHGYRVRPGNPPRFIPFRNGPSPCAGGCSYLMGAKQMVYRMAKLVPWYHSTKPQCQAVTIRFEDQCIFSALYEGTGPGKGKGVTLCKTHADMADFPVKLIEPKRVMLREDD
jgi:hypothetical protein